MTQTRLTPAAVSTVCDIYSQRIGQGFCSGADIGELGVFVPSGPSGPYSEVELLAISLQRPKPLS